MRCGPPISMAEIRERYCLRRMVARGTQLETVLFSFPVRTLPLAGNLAHWNAATGKIRSLGPLPHPDLAIFTVNSQETAIFYSHEDQAKIDIAILENYD